MIAPRTIPSGLLEHPQEVQVRLKQLTSYTMIPRFLHLSTTTQIAALWAAYYRPDRVKCATSRGGRPDLVPKEVLSHITTPTFLIVGGLDYDVIEMNKEAFEAIPSTTVKKLDIVPGATHLFEEPGTLEKVAELAAGYLKQYLQKKEE
ncbi:hypothetical protein SpCBS45565_g04559 [Spizellomyces sp. 'palustris']|nr:hypothetical protein SpCBS45565_g04559 [Spizellomyces sp. 'palustris']